MLSNRIFRVLGACLLTCFAPFGCATQRGYSGPARLKSEVSHIAIHSASEISLRGGRFDGQELGSFSSAIEVLPGEHKFELPYHREVESCQGDDSFCELTISQGVCEGTVSTLPGRNYLISVSAQFSLVQIKVLAKSYFDFAERDDEPGVGNAWCKETSSYDTFRRRRS